MTETHRRILPTYIIATYQVPLHFSYPYLDVYKHILSNILKFERYNLFSLLVSLRLVVWSTANVIQLYIPRLNKNK